MDWTKFFKNTLFFDGTGLLVTVMEKAWYILGFPAHLLGEAEWGPRLKPHMLACCTKKEVRQVLSFNQ